MTVLSDSIHIQFYLYDSNVPLKNLTMDDVASSITIYFNIPYKWSYNWTPFYYNKLHVPELWTNSEFEGFDSRGGGIGNIYDVMSDGIFGINELTFSYFI
jgi:hypothetical protein